MCIRDRNKARILIFNAKEDSRSSKTAEQQGRRAYTKEKILSSRRSSQLPVARIYLGNDFSNKRHRRTTVHEILHALGFKHEHKQKGADQELAIVNPKKLDDRQLIPEDNIHGLTRFDPFSIMISLVPRLSRGRREPGNHCMRMRQTFRKLTVYLSLIHI